MRHQESWVFLSALPLISWVISGGHVPLGALSFSSWRISSWIFLQVTQDSFQAWIIFDLQLSDKLAL